MEAFKADGAIPRRVALRQGKYLNNLIEQDHQTVKEECDWPRTMDRFSVRGGRCRHREH
jgi:transposase-like protein